MADIDFHCEMAILRIEDYRDLKKLDAYWTELAVPILADSTPEDRATVENVYAARRAALGAK
jgi:hypothetical protein